MDWIRKNHIIWKKIGITAGVYLGMKYLVPLLIPFFIAALLVCWCWPLLQWAQRRLRIKPAFVMAVLLILAAALLAGLGIWLGKSIGELQFWQSTGGTIVAIRRGQTVILSPGPYAELYGGDVIILVGSPSAAEAAHRLVTTKE